MAEMWYYTCEGKQMDPVSIKELKHLASDGVLKPTDMVWHDGMPRWIRASSVKELFPDPASALDHFFTNPKEAAVPTVSVAPVPAKSSPPEPATKKSSYPRADEEEPRTPKKRRRREDEDDAPARRRTEAKSGGSNVAIIVALLFGAFLILGAMIGGVVILIAAPRQPANPPPPPPFAIQPLPPVEIKPIPAPIPLDNNPPAEVKPGADVKTGIGSHTEAKNLLPGEEIVYKFQVKAGHAANISVTPVPSKGADFNLSVFKERDNAQVAADERPTASARVEFVLQVTEIVYAKIKNAGNTTPQRFILRYNVGN